MAEREERNAAVAVDAAGTERAYPPAVAAENVSRFVDALAFNWLVGGTDAHAKNYSLLLAGAQVRLAPLYDVASALAYDDMYPPRLKLAMKIGGEYGVEAVSGRHWRRLATAARIPEDPMIARISELAERLPQAFTTAASVDEVQELASPLPARLVDRISARAAHCRDAL